MYEIKKYMFKIIKVVQIEVIRGQNIVFQIENISELYTITCKSILKVRKNYSINNLYNQLQSKHQSLQSVKII